MDNSSMELFVIIPLFGLLALAVGDIFGIIRW